MASAAASPVWIPLSFAGRWRVIQITLIQGIKVRDLGWVDPGSSGSRMRRWQQRPGHQLRKVPIRHPRKVGSRLKWRWRRYVQQAGWWYGELPNCRVLIAACMMPAQSVVRFCARPTCPTRQSISTRIQNLTLFIFPSHLRDRTAYGTTGRLKMLPTPGVRRKHGQ